MSDEKKEGLVAAPVAAPAKRDQLPAATMTWPKWAVVPAGLELPKGKPVLPMLFRAAWTDAPTKGDRHCIVWSLSDGDEKVALSRALNDPARVAGEYSRMMIRAIDGKAVAKDGTMEGEFLLWWNEIGQKCRDQIWKVYLLLHRLDEAERDDFFGNCLAVVIPG